MDVYFLVFWLYLALGVCTLLPTAKKYFGQVHLNPSGASFSESSHFSPEAKAKLSQHYSRLYGTLGFWKKKAAVYTSFHYYCITWTILSAWAVPLIGATAHQDATAANFSKWLIVLVSSHVALSLSFHKGLRIAEGMEAFRLGESEFYDLYRRLLDRPVLFGKTEDEQIDSYFAEVERIRKLVRAAETQSIPSVETIKPSNK